jgi:predicted nucleic acid-binding Zn ribbon protein
MKDLNETLKPKRLCVVCGARVRNQNPKVNTCDSVCTNAKKSGRNRTEQQRYEIEQEAWS